MRDLAILTFVTLDGVMQGPTSPEEDPSGQFRHGGWAAPFWEGVMAQVTAEAMSVPYDVLFGRKTFEMFAAHWPKSSNDDAHAKKLNEATKYVVTSTLSELDWQNSVPITGDLVAEISRLKSEDGPLLQIHGSWQLIQALLANGLIDEFRIWTFPVVVGSGKSLFGPDTTPTKLKHIKTAPCDNGTVMNFYRRQ